MMSRLLKKLITIVIISFSCICCTQEVKIITPDLSHGIWPEVFSINPQWTVTDKTLKSPDMSDRGSSVLKTTAEDWQDYEISFKVRKIATSKKDQHFGFNFGKNIRVYTRGQDLMLYVGTQKKHARFGKKFAVPMPVGKDASWTDFTIVLNGQVLSIRVNGETVAETNDLPSRNGAFSVYTYRNYIELKDISFKIFKIGNLTATDSPNIALNSSFEESTLDTLPDYWGVPHWGISYPEIILNHQKWLTCFHTDSGNAFHGKQSMRIENFRDGPIHPALVMWSCNFGMQCGKTYVISAYLKGDRPGMKIKMHVKTQKPQWFTLTDKWQRYQYTYTRTNNSLYADMLLFDLQSRGVVWIDAVQIEPGEKATPYQPANGDRHLSPHEGNVEKEIFHVPHFRPRFYPLQLQLDGLLNDRVWKNCEAVELKSINGQVIKEKATAKIFYSDKGLYIGIDAEEKQRLNCIRKDHDDYVWLDPSFEIFLDSKLTRNTYHHFAFNADGAFYESWLGDQKWNGSWQVKTANKKDGTGWTAEVFIPFSDLNIDHSNGNLWGFNLCRNNISKGEISCWAPTYGGFHNPLRFGQLELRTDIQKKYIAGTKNISFVYAGNNENELSATAFNYTGANIDAKLICRVISPEKSERHVFEKQLVIPDGREINVVFGKIKYMECPQVEIEVKEGNHRIALYQHSAPSVRILNAVSQFNYCTNDNEMLLRGNVAVSSELLGNLILAVSVNGQDGEVFSCKMPLKKRNFELNLPVGKWENGMYQYRLSLINENQEITNLKRKFRKLPPKCREVRVDQIRRITLINGKPFFPFGLFWEGKLTADIVKYLAENGINAIHSYAPLSDDIFQAAAKHGVMLQLAVHPRRGKACEYIRKNIQQPAILSWYTYDEAFTTNWGKNNQAQILSDIAKCQKADPYRPVVLLENEFGMNYLVAKGINFPGDIPTLDFYTYPPATGNIQLWDLYSKKILACGEVTGRPAWSVLLASGYAFHASRDLTPSEQEYQVYICAINGIRGIWFWASHPKAPSSFKKICSLSREIAELVDILISLEDTPVVTCNLEKIRFTVKKYRGYLYIISVNETNKIQKAKFNLTTISDSGTAEVLFENRKNPIKTSCMEDTYAPFQRHVYKLKLHQ